MDQHALAVVPEELADGGVEQGQQRVIFVGGDRAAVRKGDDRHSGGAGGGWAATACAKEKVEECGHCAAVACTACLDSLAVVLRGFVLCLVCVVRLSRGPGRGTTVSQRSV